MASIWRHAYLSIEAMRCAATHSTTGRLVRLLLVRLFTGLCVTLGATYSSPWLLKQLLMIYKPGDTCKNFGVCFKDIEPDGNGAGLQLLFYMQVGIMALLMLLGSNQLFAKGKGWFLVVATQFLACILSGALVAHIHGFWCVSRAWQKQWCCDTIMNLARHVRGSGRNFKIELREGTALGAVRDYPKNGVGIPWEWDEDIRFRTQDVPTVKAWLRNSSVPMKIWQDPAQTSWFLHHSQVFFDFQPTEPLTELQPIEWCHVPISEGVFFVRKNISQAFDDAYGTDWRIGRPHWSMHNPTRFYTCNMYIDDHFNAFIACGSLILCVGVILVCEILRAIAVDVERQNAQSRQPQRPPRGFQVIGQSSAVEPAEMIAEDEAEKATSYLVSFKK